MQLIVAASEPAGGAALGQVALATAMAMVATGALLWLIARHRSGRGALLARAGAFSERVSGLPGWAALPSGVAAVSLLTALLGMYWDIALHIGVGRDEGPLANPAHYLILAGLFGVFSAGVLAMALPRDGERPGAAAIKLGHDWYAPVGGVLIAACGAFALVGFPLDDVWHRLFGQDVTLWGPTHLMLIGGAGMTLIGQAVLLAEGMRARGRAGGPAAGAGPSAATGADHSGPDPFSPGFVTAMRRVGLMGGLLIGLSTFQAEFDFGVPQFALVLQPILIAFAASVALVAARMWIGPGGALGAAAFFLVVRGAVSLLVGPVFGESTPVLPLYAAEALCVEAAALAIGRQRPLALGAAAGVLAGTVGFWAEYGWSQMVMPIPWNAALLPEGLVLSAVAGISGGLLGGLLGAALRGELPRAAVARSAFAVSLLALAALIGNGLVTSTPEGVRATLDLEQTRPEPRREAHATVRIQPASAGEDVEWLNMTSWQGGGLRVSELESVSPGVWRTSEPVPLYGDWKTLVRLHGGRALIGVPVFLPRDQAIPAPEVPAEPGVTRTFVDETELLQRELKDDVPSWLWRVAELTVLGLGLLFVSILAWGLARVARRGARPSGPPRSGLDLEPDVGAAVKGAPAVR